jgi:hypothetical protein
MPSSKERPPYGRSRKNKEKESENQGNQKQEEHNALVDTLRKYITLEEKVFGEFLTREEIIRMKLNFEEESADKKKQKFFAPLRRAWDALAYERYEPGSTEEYHSGELLSRYCRYYSEPTIKPVCPLQVKVIDALTEACGIPHQPGQTEIAIPERLKSYDTWTDSAEYRERLANAQAARRQKGEEHYARLCSESLEPQK